MPPWTIVLAILVLRLSDTTGFRPHTSRASKFARAHAGPVNSLCFAPDGLHLVTAGTDNRYGCSFLDLCKNGSGASLCVRGLLHVATATATDRAEGILRLHV